MTNDDRMVACRFVLDHCGGHHQLTPSSPASMREAWRDGISHLGPISNVYCKLSGLLGAQGGAEGGGGGVVGWSPDAQRETVRHGLTACLLFALITLITLHSMEGPHCVPHCSAYLSRSLSDRLSDRLLIASLIRCSTAWPISRPNGCSSAAIGPCALSRRPWVRGSHAARPS